MSVGLRKALNKQECAVKPKHLIATTAETHIVKGERKLWAYVEKLPLNTNSILAWKFCYLLHRLITDGHPRALIYAVQKRGKLIDLGQNWSLSLENYAEEIQIYTALLDTKLKFHAQFPQFPGNLMMTPEELRKIGGTGISIYSEITMAITDYLQLICELRTSIFKSIKRSRCNSMMPEGQCRLQPIMLCFQDSVRLHDIVSNILELSPSCLPLKLTDYRERYREQMKSFHDSYDKAIKYQFLFDTMTEEVKTSHESQTTPEALEGSEGVAEILIQSKKLYQGQARNQKVFHRTIGALEEISQQFVSVLSAAKDSLETGDMEPVQNIESAGSSKEHENVPKNEQEQVNVAKSCVENVRDNNKEQTVKTSEIDDAILEKKLDAFLERYFARKFPDAGNLKTEEIAEISNRQTLVLPQSTENLAKTGESSAEDFGNNDSQKRAEKVLELSSSMEQPPQRTVSVPNLSFIALRNVEENQNSEPIQSAPNPFSENEELLKPETPIEEESMKEASFMPEFTIEDFWEYADKDDSGEYATILGQRLQEMLKKTNAGTHDFDMSKLKYIDEESSTENGAEDDSSEKQKDLSESESEISSLGDRNEDDVKNNKAVDKTCNDREHFEKNTLTTILKQLQKIQEVLLKYQK